MVGSRTGPPGVHMFMVAEMKQVEAEMGRMWVAGKRVGELE